MTAKILFLSFDPFNADTHITKEVKEYLPIARVVSVDEITDEDISEDFDYDSISYVISTAGAEFHACQDKERRGMYNPSMIWNETMIDSKEEFSEEFDDPDEAEEEWMGYIIAAYNNFYEHIYVIEVELDEE